MSNTQTNLQSPRQPDFSPLLILVFLIVILFGHCSTAKAQMTLPDSTTAGEVVILPDGYAIAPDFGIFYAVKYTVDKGHVTEITATFDPLTPGLDRLILETYCPACQLIQTGPNGSWYFDHETGADMMIFGIGVLQVLPPARRGGER